MARDYYDRERNLRMDRDRSMWDRSRDEVRSWFGDEDAERRRMQDQRQADWEEQSRRRGNPYRALDQRQETADAEFDRDWDLDDNANYGPFRNDPPLLGSPGRERHPRRGRPAPAHGHAHYHQGHDHYSDYRYNDYRAEEDFTGLGPSGYRRADERIREDVSEVLTWDRRLDATGISVEVADGVATLSGQVRDRRMKRRAEDLTESVRGISDVNNHLSVGAVTPAEQSSDSGLR